MDTGNEHLSAQAHTFSRAPEAILADLQSGLDGLRSLLAEIAAREAQLGTLFGRLSRDYTN
jgi:hypothetical protein